MGNWRNLTLKNLNANSHIFHLHMSHTDIRKQLRWPYNTMAANKEVGFRWLFQANGLVSFTRGKQQLKFSLNQTSQA